MKRLRFSLFSLVVLLPIVVAVLAQVLSNCWASRRVQWAPIDEMLGNEERSNGILLVSYYSTADVTTYYLHAWMSKHGGRVVRRYGIQPYALDQMVASSKQNALIARMFPGSRASTGIGVLDLAGDEPRSQWRYGSFVSEDEFEQWLVEFIEDGRS